MKRSFFLYGFYIFLIVISSCKKDEPVTNVATFRPNSMTELTSTLDFSWQTVRYVKVKLQGSHVMTCIIKTSNGDVLFKSLVKPASKVETTIEIPLSINEVIVTYGPISKTVSLKNNSIDCTFDLNNF
ncbi:MAG: hypothetical protein WCO13_04150 [Bacteroidota bacterium]